MLEKKSKETLVKEIKKLDREGLLALAQVLAANKVAIVLGISPKQ